MLSTDKSAPLVCIIGVTGGQGGSVLRNLLESDKPYRFRGLTRDASKPSSAALAEKGVEMVSCTVSVENEAGIKAAFEGADIIFAVTDYWSHMDKQREIDEGKMLVDAAKANSSLKLFVWSGLESVSTGSKGKYVKTEHFDSKAEVTEYGRKSGIPFVNVQPGFYASNLLGNMGPKKQEDGTYTVSLPISPKSVFSVMDTGFDYGLFVREAIESEEFGAGSEVLAAGEELTIEEMVKQLAQASGKKIVYKQLTVEEYQAPMKAPQKIKDEMTENMLFIQDFGYYFGKSIKPSNTHLARPARTWAEFVKHADWSKVFA